MRKFSEDLTEDREFEIGGEVFRYRLFHFTETVEMLDHKVDESVVINADGSYSFKLDTEWCLKQIYTYLDGPEEVKRFKARLANKKEPVPHIHILDLYRWLRERVQALPTKPPSSEPSANGGGTTEAGSSAGQPSTEVPSKA